MAKKIRNFIINIRLFFIDKASWQQKRKHELAYTFNNLSTFFLSCFRNTTRVFIWHQKSFCVCVQGYAAGICCLWLEQFSMLLQVLVEEKNNNSEITAVFAVLFCPRYGQGVMNEPIDWENCWERGKVQPVLDDYTCSLNGTGNRNLFIALKYYFTCTDNMI